jgi:hypothetical protein
MATLPALRIPVTLDSSVLSKRPVAPMSPCGRWAEDIQIQGPAHVADLWLGCCLARAPPAADRSPSRLALAGALLRPSSGFSSALPEGIALIAAVSGFSIATLASLRVTGAPFPDFDEGAPRPPPSLPASSSADIIHRGPPVRHHPGHQAAPHVQPIGRGDERRRSDAPAMGRPCVEEGLWRERRRAQPGARPLV